MFRSKDIIGPQDSRRPVDDTLTAPFKFLGLIYGKNREQDQASFSGTGWLAGPDAFVTAAHVVFNKQVYWRGGFAKITKIWLALNGEDKPPFPVRVAVDISVHENYLSDQSNIDYDVAVVKLDRGFDGRHGWLACSDGCSESNELLIAGYPRDLQKTPSRMFSAIGKARRLDGLRLYHDIDSFGGQSGAPVIIREGGGYRVAAIHTRGTDEAKRLNLEANMAVRLEGEILDWLKMHI